VGLSSRIGTRDGDPNADARTLRLDLARVVLAHTHSVAALDFSRPSSKGTLVHSPGVFNVLCLRRLWIAQALAMRVAMKTRLRTTAH